MKAEDISVQYLRGIRTKQLNRVTENRELGNPHTATIHVGTNVLRISVNHDSVMGDEYALMNAVKTKPK
jgi:hypothetical protein